MKKILFSFLTLLFLADANAQTVQASLGAGSTANSIRIYLRPDITNPAVAISTLQFNVAIPAGITPVPTLSVTTNNIVGTSWLIEPAYTEGGYIHYNIYNNQSLYTLNCTAGVEFQAMEVTFNGGPAGTYANAAHLVTLPDGGTGGGGAGFAIFYCTSAVAGVLNSNGQQLYYSRDANVVHSNGDSYRPVPPGTIGQRGTVTSYARYIPAISLGGVLPVIFASFDAKCSNNNGASLTWVTATEQNSSRFEVERSDNNGLAWKTVGTVAAAGNSSDARNYNFLDLYSGDALYRIRQVDLDGKSTYTTTQRTNCKQAGYDIALYPVPAKDNLTVVIKSDVKVKTELVVVDVKGSTLLRIPAYINTGSNNLNINVTKLPVGQYVLRSSDPGVQVDKKFTIVR